MQFALTYAAATFDTRTKMMGRQAAGLGFLRAALDAGLETIWCHARTRGEAEVFGRDVQALKTASIPPLRFVPWSQPARLADVGLLFRPDPALADDAWRRQRVSGARAWSLCGITHTLSSKAAMACAAPLLHAPLQSWDAVICTSTVARDVLRQGLETEIEHLRSRLGATTFTLPQFPLIPLGVHAADFVFAPEVRAASRAHLGIAEADVAILFPGRLSFHAKAHPVPMFLGLEAAATRSGVRVHLVLFGLFPNEAIETAFREEAARLAPSVRLHVLDGRSDADRDRAWSCADIFTSLADNIQETFGLTPVEAMAAGLPCVVSDWNGYKDTVRHGVDGFRVPTLMAPAGAGEDLADEYDADVVVFDAYAGATCLHVAVAVDAAAEAYHRLIVSPELRRRMGEAGRQRARSDYDWSVVFGRYVALWDDLAERRRADITVPGEASRARRPDRPDPFTLFRSYPSATLRDESRIAPVPGVDAAEAAARCGLKSIAFAPTIVPPAALVLALVSRVSGTPGITLAALQASLDGHTPLAVLRAVLVLAKVGALQVQP
jgi:glycosyltransferase involved in cell wall biosynthesis